MAEKKQQPPGFPASGVDRIVRALLSRFCPGTVPEHMRPPKERIVAELVSALRSSPPAECQALEEFTATPRYTPLELLSFANGVCNKVSYHAFAQFIGLAKIIFDETAPKKGGDAKTNGFVFEYSSLKLS